MPKSSVNVSLNSYDDIFSTEESRQEEQREQVQQIPIDALHPFTNHPFKVLDDEAMTRTVESIAQYSVLAPLIARPRPDGNGYEIISGHCRQYAAKLAGLETLPVIVRQMSDDAAVILMVDSNLQREHILPSERAFAYKMKLEAIKNQGARSDLTSDQVGQKLWSVEQVASDAGESKTQIQRFIRLTNLVPEQQLVQAQEEYEEATKTAKRSNYICNELFTWADVYDTANHDERRAILQQFIKEIRVRKDYEISITLNASFDQVEQLKAVSTYDGAEIFEEISEKGA